MTSCTPGQSDAFSDEGILALRGLIPRTRTESAKECILRELIRLRLRENGKWHTRMFDGMSSFQVAFKIGQQLRQRKQFDDVIPEDLVAYLDVLAGCRLKPAQSHPNILVTPPQRDEWVIPVMGWHVDVAAPVRDVIPGVQVFVLLDDVAPRGGGTLAIRGSHRSRGVLPTPENVFEMSGKAGDVFLMDMRVLHAPSINSTKYARMMLTSRYLNPRA